MRPNAPLVAGLALVALGTVGYVVGVLVAYPGRSLSVAGVAIGIALLAVGGGRASGGGRR